MKTLDEVIKALEMCTADKCVCLYGCPYSHLADGDDGCEYHAIPEMQKDALHYLKMYRSDKIQYEADRKNWNDNYAVKLARLENATAKHMQALKELQIGMKNDPLTWDELFSLGLIGRPVWSEEKRAWFLIADSALDNRSWVDLADACGKITRLGPHDLEKYQLYKREKK